MKVYVVTKNGWERSYGAEIYLLGVFDNLQDAEQANGKITEIDLNTTYPLVYDDEHDESINSYYLGGYVE